MAGNIGMMNEAYFLSKAVLLEWVNNFSQSSVEKVEHMATGACYCNIFDGLHPKTIPMSKVDFSVKYDYEYAKNWKLLQNAFQKVGIKKQIPVERLTKARYQDNLEFLQWFYKYAHDSYPGDCDNPDYDAISARNRSKGGRDFGNSNNNHPRLRNNNNNNKMSRGKENNMLGNQRPPSARSHSNMHNNKYNNNNNNNSRGYRNTQGISQGRRGISRNDGMQGGGMNSQSDNLEDPSILRELETLREENNKLMGNNEALEKQLESVTNDHTELRNVAKDIEKERDFYFNKVLEVETICKGHKDQQLDILTKIYNILYATDDGDGNSNGNVNGNNNINSNNINNNNGVTEDASISMNVNSNGSDINSVDNLMNDGINNNNNKIDMMNQGNNQQFGENGSMMQQQVQPIQPMQGDVDMNGMNSMNANNMMPM